MNKFLAICTLILITILSFTAVEGATTFCTSSRNEGNKDEMPVEGWPGITCSVFLESADPAVSEQTDEQIAEYCKTSTEENGVVLADALKAVGETCCTDGKSVCNPAGKLFTNVAVAVTLLSIFYMSM